MRGPLIKKAFELFATGHHTKREVRKMVTDLGLRTVNGNKVPMQTFDHNRRRVTDLTDRKQRLVDAFIDHAVDRPTFQEQMARLEEELAAARLAVQEGQDDGFDMEAVLGFTEQIMVNAASFWQGLPLDQRQRLQKVLPMAKA